MIGTQVTVRTIEGLETDVITAEGEVLPAETQAALRDTRDTKEEIAAVGRALRYLREVRNSNSF